MRLKTHYSLALGLHRKSIVVLLACMFCLPATVHAQEATLNNIIVTNTRDDLLVYLMVEGAFEDKLLNVIQSGVPTTFSFFINLYRKRTFWVDKKLAEINVTHTIKYDNLKNTYSITRSWEGATPLVVKDFAEARKLMTEIDGLNLAPLSLLEKGERYQIRTKAELSRITLPLYLHYVFFFVSIWDFETDWYTIDFIY